MTKFVEIKLLAETADIPKYATPGSAGLDLRALRVMVPGEDGQDVAVPILKDAPLIIQPGQTVKVGTGIAVHIGDPALAGFILPRSGKGAQGLVLGNLVGLVDSDYQGELIVALWNRTSGEFARPLKVEAGEKVAQYVIMPVMQVGLLPVTAFAESLRGVGGFGSTG